MRDAGMPTCSKSSPTRDIAFFSPIFSWTRIGSAICFETRWTGLSELMQPWKTIEACAQRTARNSRQFIVRMSAPSSRISPVTFVDFGSSRRTAAMSVDLPQPDSPATPSVCPESKVRLTPRTAGTSPSPVRYVTQRSLVSSRLTGRSPLLQPRVEHRFQRVADPREGKDDQHDRDARRKQVPPRLL